MKRLFDCADHYIQARDWKMLEASNSASAPSVFCWDWPFPESTKNAPLPVPSGYFWQPISR